MVYLTDKFLSSTTLEFSESFWTLQCMHCSFSNIKFFLRTALVSTFPNCTELYWKVANTVAGLSFSKKMIFYRRVSVPLNTKYNMQPKWVLKKNPNLNYIRVFFLHILVYICDKLNRNTLYVFVLYVWTHGHPYVKIRRK